MGLLALKVLTSGLLFLFTLASGVWLSHSGKPLNTLILTTHKLIALASVVLLGTAVYILLLAVQVQPLALTMLILTGCLALALFITGAFLSLGKPVNKILLFIHRIAPALMVTTTVATIYLLTGLS